MSGDRFDKLSRDMSGSMPRRGVLKAVGGAIVGAVAASVVGPFRANAQETASCQPGQTPCGPSCCNPGLICVNAGTGRCGCDPSIKTFCGGGCCDKNDTCSDPATVTCCCKGDTPCGTSCCKSGVACINKKKGLCGCPAGTTACGTGATMKCCPAGTTCSSGKCFRATPEEPGFGPGYATPCSTSSNRPCTCYTQCPSGQNCFGAPFGPGQCISCIQTCVSGTCGSGSVCVAGCCHPQFSL
jgi:hypothetical protein